MKRIEHRQRYVELEPVYSRLRTTLYGILKNALEQASVDVLAIDSRVKTFDSFHRKIQEKGYDDPFSECTDFVGLRVIVYLESDVDKVAEVVKTLVDVDQKKSADKRHADTPSTVGYRSLHLVGKLGSRRSRLPEYGGLTDHFVEIQVRTALQHAWAAIEHKRNYKGEHALPPDLEHRLMILAGALELVDKEFSRISLESDDYNRRALVENSEEQNDRITSVAALAVINSEFKNLGYRPLSRAGFGSNASMALEELAAFGIDSVKDFRDVIKRVDLAPIAEANTGSGVFIGVIRDLMIAADAEKYFRDCWKGRWHAIGPAELGYLNRAARRNDLEEVFSSNDIEIDFHLDEE